MAQIICVSNEKGGVEKSVTSANLSVGLFRQGYKILAIDADPGRMGKQQCFEMSATLLADISTATSLMPSSISLANMEILLVQAFGREAILKQYIDMVRDEYSHIVIDASPSLGLLTVNRNRMKCPARSAFFAKRKFQRRAGQGGAWSCLTKVSLIDVRLIPIIAKTQTQ
ncbi:MAG: AAA family ATPase [Clostridiales bacterium]|jgi:chromosome partitioning protein|nr:AAA family ATPase [Clostridiales bacterium]